MRHISTRVFTAVLAHHYTRRLCSNMVDPSVLLHFTWLEMLFATCNSILCPWTPDHEKQVPQYLRERKQYFHYSYFLWESTGRWFVQCCRELIFNASQGSTLQTGVSIWGSQDFVSLSYFNLNELKSKPFLLLSESI